MMRSLLVWMLILVGGFPLSPIFGQTVSLDDPSTAALEGSSDDCISDNMGNVGQFMTTIYVQSLPGENWTLENVSNIFAASATNQGASSPISSGVLGFSTDGNGVFSFSFNHIEQLPFSFELVRTGVSPTTLTIPDDLTDIVGAASQSIDFSTWHHLPTQVDGLGSICNETLLDTYSVPDHAGHTYDWRILAGAGSTAFVGPNDENEVTIQFDGSLPVGSEVMLELDVTTPEGCSTTLSHSVFIEEDIALACNNNIQLSMNANCMVELFPDMVLEDYQFRPESYQIRLEDLNTGEIVHDMMLTEAHIGHTLKATVTHLCSGNSCWSRIVVEDKFTPSLSCPDEQDLDCDDPRTPTDLGFPDGLEALIVPHDTNDPDRADLENPVDSFYISGPDMCGIPLLTYEDLVEYPDCGSSYSSIITRRWKLITVSGAEVSCDQIININEDDLDPFGTLMNFDGDNGLFCEDKDNDDNGREWKSDENGHPHPDHTGYPDVSECGNFWFTYKDEVFAHCSGQVYKKIRRRWTVINECNNEQASHNQLIMISDLEDPVCELPDNVEAYTSGYDCLSTFKIFPEIFEEGCSTIDSVRMGYQFIDSDEDIDDLVFIYDDKVTFNPADTSFTFTNLKSDAAYIQLKLEIWDQCGNKSECSTKVKLVNGDDPIAICDRHVTVALSEQGEGWADVYAFDDGSWDNCSDLDYHIRRTVKNAECDSTAWQKELIFCCSDLGKSIEVELRVRDSGGNENVCTSYVTVQDNSSQTILECPKDTTITCIDEIKDISTLGEAIYKPGCANYSPPLDTTHHLNACGTGYIERRFAGWNLAGNASECIQIITIKGLEDFEIEFPEDLDTIGCKSSSLDPDDLPAEYGNPVTKNDECSSIFSFKNDLAFYDVDGVCVKILREWTVVDWCTYQGDESGEGSWKHTQVIKLTDDQKPTITKGCDNITLTGSPIPDCRVMATVEAEAIDNCGINQDSWRVEVDFENDGNINYVEKGLSSFQYTFPYGTHRFDWSVEDECGNVQTCSQLITFVDDKKPTPICLTEVVLVVMKDKDTKIWASDFVTESSFDNCSKEVNLDYSFSPTSRDDNSIEFSCDDLNGESEVSKTLNVYVWDEAGNNDFCTVDMVLQDNRGVCSGDDNTNEENETSARITGSIQTENFGIMTDVEVMLKQGGNSEMRVASTDDFGDYAFADLAMYKDYTLEPIKEDNPANGLSTADLIIIQNHILGLKPLKSAYKVIAADVNASGTISAADMVQIRKMIIGQITEFANSPSWRFIDASVSFDNPMSPFPHAEYINMYDIDKNMQGMDFVGVKMGDVQGNAKLNNATDTEIRSNNTSYLYTDDLRFEKYQNLEIPIKVESDVALKGFQMSIELDIANVELVDIVSNVVPLDNHAFQIHQNEEYSFVNISFSSTEMILAQRDTPIFSLLLKSKNDGVLSENIYMNSSVINPEIYIPEYADPTDFETQNLQLRFHEIDHAGKDEMNSFELLQNTPNPFTGITQIAFTLPKSTFATLTIYDVKGQVLYKRRAMHNQGLNEVEVDLSDYPYSGILYYQLETETHTANKKMITIR